MSSSRIAEGEERSLVVERFNAGADDGIAETTVVARFAAVAASTPGAPAVLSLEGSLSYAELDARSNRLARHLARLGVGPDVTVALCLERTPELIVTLLAILKSGGAYVPLEPTYPKQRMAFMLSDAKPRVLVTSRALAELLPEELPQQIVLERDADAVARESDAPLAVELRPEHLAYVLYTSGSTGTPKGAAVTHAAIDRLVHEPRYAKLDSSVCILQAAPVAFDASTFEIWGALCNGGKLALHQEPIPTARGLRAAIERFGVTTMWLTAALFNTVIDEDAEALAGLSELLTGGEALSVPHIRRALSRLPRTQLINGYGPTETTTFATCYRIPRDLAEGLTAIPIGYAIRRTRLYVLNEQKQPVAQGEVGELYIGGRGVARGYLGRDDLTRERFLDDPFKPGERLYRTGDLVRQLSDGCIDYIGRADQQVKIRGFRIELGEIESALTDLPEVLRAVVTARPSSSGEKRLVAYCVLESGHSARKPALMRADLGQRLPEYMLPVAFVWLPSIPVTDNGKVDYRALPEPAQERGELDVAFVVPEGEREQQLAQVFQELIGIDRVGTLDNLFELGITSLLVVRAVARLRERFGIELPVVKVFQYPTVAGIAAYLERPQPGGLKASQRRESSGGAVAIVGMAGRFPGAQSVPELWQNLCGGVDSIARFSDAELDASVPARQKSDPRYVKARGILNDVEHFDAAFFGITPKEAALMDPQQRVLFEVAWEALESAGYVPDKTQGAIGVYAGKYNDSYYAQNVLTRPDLIEELGEFQVMVANEKDYVATRLAHRLDLKGPALSIHSACSTSLVATAMAVAGLRSGQCDVALAGGVSITVPVKSGYIYNEGAMLSADGATRSFDAQATGTVFSDGAAMVVLKRLEDAIADRDTIYGVILGAAINNDGGNKSSFTAPSVDGQARVIAAAHADAGIEPQEVGYVEAHGTATPLGDPIEVEALNLAFGEGLPKASCGIGSIKSNLGHTVIAAGATALIKVALSLKNELLPASLHFDSANPKIDFASGPFSVVAKNTRWPAGAKRRVAGVSSFGVGGTNAHVVVSEAPATVARDARHTSSELLLVSARSEAALDASLAALAADLERSSERPLADVAFTLHAGRRDFPQRAAIVAANATEAAAQLRAQAGKARRAEASAPRVAFMFPGQGSQHVGMGAALVQQFPHFAATVQQCLSFLPEGTRQRLEQLVFSSETASTPELEAELSQTSLAQPALFIMEYALAKQYQALGVQPHALLGHSVGEFVCAVVASVMTLEGALKLVAERGQRMQGQPRGSMLSVRLPAEEVRSKLPGSLAVATDNAPNLCVVAGPTDEIQAFSQKLEAEGAVCRLLHTSHAFHSPMMDAVVEPFRELVAALELKAPLLPIISTVTGERMTAEQATDPSYWARQLRNPVQFRGALATLVASAPKQLLLEVGPRQTLAVLSRQQLPAAMRSNILGSLSDQSAAAAEALRRALGDLWCAGVPVAAGDLHGSAPVRVPLPTYPFERKRYWVERADVAGAAAPTPTVTIATAPVVATPPAPPAAPIPQPVPAAAPTPLPLPTPSQVPDMSNNYRDQIIDSLCAALEETSGLEISPAEADVPFMELGLDSLFLTQFALTVSRKFSVKVSFRELQEDFPNMGTLADKIASQNPAPAAATAPAAAAPVAAAAPAAAMPAAAPVYAAQPVYAAPMVVGSHDPNPVKAIIDQQLQIMAAQLAVLGGGAVQMPVAQPAPVAAAPAPVVAAPAPVVAAAATAAPASARPAAAAAPAAAEEGEGGPMKYDVKKAFGAIARIHTGKVEDLTPKQRARLDAFIRRYNTRTKSSKQFTQDNRYIMADPRAVTGFKPTVKELVYPIVVDRSAGSKLWDIDGNEYVDALNGFGLNLFGWQPDFVTKAIEAQLHRGHEIGPQHPLNAEVAKLICEFTKFDRAAFCNTGSEAVMGCMRIARTVTGKSLVAIMTGSYHGIFDEVVVRGTKKLRSIPAAPGIMPSSAQNVLVLDYGTPESLEILKSRADELAGIMVEPIQSRRPDFRPKEFLTELRVLTEKASIPYIFDEVVTGFRLCPGGAQEYFGFQADLASYGKVVGGGLPIGVIAGKKPFMDALDGGYWEFGDHSSPPVGVTYFAGTFVRHPLALAAAKAVLTHLKEQGPELQRRLNERVAAFVDDLNKFCRSVEAPIELKSVASLWRAMYTTEQTFGDLLFYMMRDRGVHIYDGFPCFFTTAHSEADFAHIAKAFKESVAELQDAGFLPEPSKKASSPTTFDPSSPPVPGARLGRDPAGNPAWFVPNPNSPSQYVKLETN